MLKTLIKYGLRRFFIRRVFTTIDFIEDFYLKLDHVSKKGNANFFYKQFTVTKCFRSWPTKKQEHTS